MKKYGWKNVCQSCDMKTYIYMCTDCAGNTFVQQYIKNSIA